MNTLKTILFTALVAFLLAALAACNANLTSLDPNTSPGVKLGFAAPSQAKTSSPILGASGASTATGLQSLKVNIYNIRLVGDIKKITGSGFDTPLEPFFDVYRTMTENDAQGKDTASYAASADSEMTDLLDASSISKIQVSTPLLKDHVGTYKYVLFYSMRYTKIKGSFAMNNGKTLYTRSSTTSGRLGNFDVQVASASLTNGPAQELTYASGGAGGWFKLLKPLKITDEDLRANAKFKLFMVFDPVGAVQVYDSAASNSGADVIEMDTDANTNFIGTPALDFAAVVYKEGQSVYRSTYEATLNGPNGSTGYKFRFEVFTVAEDPGAIYSCVIRAIPTGASAAPATSRVSEVEQNASGKLTFKSPTTTSSFNMIDNFVQLTNVGDSSSAIFGGASSSSQTAAYSLIEKAKVN
ncbi:MAG: hypothetical protein JNM63_00580 [Spirochaetia bacterium]|nr:hypothetical protein [Spirochaetia bacterium]